MKTSFVVKYMKQGFIINVIEIFIAIIGGFMWFLFGIIGTLNAVCFFTSVWLAYQAYSGNDHVITILYTYSEKLIQGLGISNLFIPGK